MESDRTETDKKLRKPWADSADEFEIRGLDGWRKDIVKVWAWPHIKLDNMQS